MLKKVLVIAVAATTTVNACELTVQEFIDPLTQQQATQVISALMFSTLTSMPESAIGLVLHKDKQDACNHDVTALFDNQIYNILRKPTPSAYDLLDLTINPLSGPPLLTNELIEKISHKPADISTRKYKGLILRCVAGLYSADRIEGILRHQRTFICPRHGWEHKLTWVLADMTQPFMGTFPTNSPEEYAQYEKLVQQIER